MENKPPKIDVPLTDQADVLPPEHGKYGDEVEPLVSYMAVGMGNIGMNWHYWWHIQPYPGASQKDMVFDEL